MEGRGGGGDGGGGEAGLEEPAQLTVVVLDVSPWAWASATGRRPLGLVLGDLAAFLRALLLVRAGNRFAVMVASGEGTCFVVPNEAGADDGVDAGVDVDGNGGDGGGLGSRARELLAEEAGQEASGFMADLEGILRRRVAALSRVHAARGDAARAGAGAGAPPGGGLALSAALSRALLYINRAARGDGDAQAGGRDAGEGGGSGAPAGDDDGRPAFLWRPRVLCVVCSPDVPGQHIAAMNAVFAAQGEGVVIDGLVVPHGRGGEGGEAEATSLVLQQAAHLTGGTYLAPPQALAREGLLQLLLSVFLPCPGPGGARPLLNLPAMPEDRAVDLRASCFCHSRPVSNGLVCSVCLSVFCDEGAADAAGRCPTCGTDVGAPPPWPFAPPAAAV